MNATPPPPQWRHQEFADTRVMLVGTSPAARDFLRAMLHTLGVGSVTLQADLAGAGDALSHLRCHLLMVTPAVLSEAPGPTLRALRERKIRVCLLEAGADHALVREGSVDTWLAPPYMASGVRGVLASELRALSAA